VLWPLAGEPLVALQWASAASSVLLVWPLALLGRRVAPPSVATLAAVTVSLLPGPWLFAVRGFSSTARHGPGSGRCGPVERGDLAGRRTTAFTLLLTAAFLVRPILLPVIGLLWLAGVATVRPWTRALPGVLTGLGAVGVAVGDHGVAGGGWEAFAFPFVRHFGSHTGRLHLNTGGFTDLGLVKGVGGVPWALLLAAVVAVGLVVWARRVNRRSAAVWAVVMAALVIQLLTLQNRTYPRYAVAAQLAAAPLVAGTAALLPTPVGVGVLAVAAAGAVGASLPLVFEQHRRELPAWTAACRAETVAREQGWAVVVGPEVHAFASYRWHVLEREGIEPPPLILSPRAPEPWEGVDPPVGRGHDPSPSLPRQPRRRRDVVGAVFRPAYGG
jgi:asparagine N-glycosylation enzyme membrane subunit Stt3